MMSEADLLRQNAALIEQNEALTELVRRLDRRLDGRLRGVGVRRGRARRPSFGNEGRGTYVKIKCKIN